MKRLTSRTRRLLGLGFVLALVLVVGALPAAADTTAQALPFAQNWANTGLITTNDDWAGVPGVVGYLGQDNTTATATHPQTLSANRLGANDLGRDRNQTKPAISMAA